MDKVYRETLNLQLTWLMLLVLIYVFGVLSVVQRVLGDSSGLGLSAGITTHAMQAFLILIPLAYLYNITTTVLNSIRIYKGQAMYRFPRIPFFRT